MDLSNLATHGQSATRAGWLTNPVRRVIWWLVCPYFQGAGSAIENRLQDHATSIERLLREMIASQLGGMRKDATAAAHRLAGLEEEAAALAGRIDALKASLEALMKESPTRKGKTPARQAD